MILVTHQHQHDCPLLTGGTISLMAAIISTRFPHKAPELLAYQAVIVHTKRNYEGTQSVSYDHRYQQEALVRKDLNWSVPDVQYRMSQGNPIQQCLFCLQDDHDQNTCPQNLHHPSSGVSLKWVYGPCQCFPNQQ